MRTIYHFKKGVWFSSFLFNEDFSYISKIVLVRNIGYDGICTVECTK